ncbi:hypothetical protein AB4143_05165 [Vibrio breoganii]
MFLSIHAQTQYRIDRINSEGAIGLGAKGESEIAVRMRNGTSRSIKFGGFLEVSNVAGIRYIKLLSIRFLCSDWEAEVIEYKIPSTHYVVGAYIDGRVFVLLWDGKPRHYKDNSLDDRYENNVISIN